MVINMKSNKRFFFVGDIYLDNGPGIANRSLYDSLNLKKNISFSICRNKVARVFESIVKTLKSDVLVFISSSNINLFLIIICKLTNKKSVYLMHGLLHYEYELSQNNFSIKIYDKLKKYDTYMIQKNDVVVCVSKKLKEFLCKKYSIYNSKILYNYNGILGASQIRCNKKEKENAVFNIISVGGGMRRKNNIQVCKAIEYLINKYNLNIVFTCIGINDIDTCMMKKFKFVRYIEKLDHSDLLDLMKKSDLYVQNSTFETFGLAVIEALLSGCGILISKNVGALGVFNSLSQDDIIFDVNDINEISYKIYTQLSKTNYERVIKCLDYNLIDSKKASENLIKILEEYEYE